MVWLQLMMRGWSTELWIASRRARVGRLVMLAATSTTWRRAVAPGRPSSAHDDFHAQEQQQQLGRHPPACTAQLSQVPSFFL
jgi:hypothetical protein